MNKKLAWIDQRAKLRNTMQRVIDKQAKRDEIEFNPLNKDNDNNIWEKIENV